MAEIEFFEKPGCINGEKQKAILARAGHGVHCIDILTYPWDQQSLLPFLGGGSPVLIMNSTAPAIKNGDLDPEQLSFDEAVDLMIDSPILIKRPLIKVDGLCIQGFTDKRLIPYLGDWSGDEDVVTCPNLATLSCDDRAEG